MIPLVVCGTGSASAWLMALSICLVAVLAGWAIGTRHGRGRLARRLGFALVAGLMLPGLLIAGWFPFDPAWRYDCGATPDPNLEVYYAVLAFPIVIVAICWLSAKRRRV